MITHVTTGWDVLNTFMGTIPQLCTSLATIILGWFAFKQFMARAELQNKENKETLTRIERQTNGLTEKLVNAEGLRAHAEGMVDEQARVASQINLKP